MTARGAPLTDLHREHYERRPDGRHSWWTCIPTTEAIDNAREAVANRAARQTPDSDSGLRRWATDFIRAAAAQLHDVNGHLRWEGNKPTEPPFDWTTNCQHSDCINARRWLATPEEAAPEEPWRCDWTPDDLNPGPDCPYCAGQMCARIDGLGCTHNRQERHGYAATPAPTIEGLRPFIAEAIKDLREGAAEVALDGLVAVYDRTWPSK